MSILFKTLASLNSGPEVPEVKPLTFRNTGTGTIAINTSKTGSPNVAGLQYRMEGEKSWQPYTFGKPISIPNKGDAVQFQNTNDTLSTSSSNYMKFTAGSMSTIAVER